MPEVPPRLRFGRVELLPVQRQLLVDGRPASLGARAFDLLLALISHRDRLVTKNELLDLVWPGLVVEEGNLKVQVSTLRKLIGPEAIATIPARGYRFALPLDDDDQALTAAGATPPYVPSPNAAELPVAGVAMIGRDDDLAALLQLLQRSRIVTLLGAGGIGKTTLALAVSQSVLAVPGVEVVWVELASLSDPALVPFALMHALRLSAGDRTDRQDALPSLLAALRARPMLVIMDNAEHLIGSVASLLQALVVGTDTVTALVTSQAALKLPAEHIYRVGPLEVPEAGTPLVDALRFGAVALFAERAQAALRQFTVNESNLSTVIAICRGLDGLALAIELAAARLPLFGVEGLATRLDERLRLLAGGVRSAPTRQQTLRAAFDWSHGLLTSAEQAVFRRLGTFVGGFTLDLAAAAASDAALDRWAVIDILGTLVERSLVAVDGDDPPRYRLLESARAYAALMLEGAGERMAQQRRHAEAMCADARRRERLLWLMPEEQWLAQGAPELDNLRAALDWSTQHAPALAILLAAASFPLFSLLALLHESRRRTDPLEPLLDVAAVAADDAAAFLRVRSVQMRDISVQTQHALATRAARLHRESGNDRGLYETLFVITSCFHDFADDAQAAALEMAALERPDWPAPLRALGRIAQSSVAYVEHRMADNRAELEAALPMVAPAGADRLTMAVLSNLADHVLLMGPIEEAVRRGVELTDLLRRTHRNAQLPFALCNLANAHLQHGEPAAARLALAEAFEVMRVQQWSWVRGFGDVYALLAAGEGRLRAAARLLGWADQVRTRRGALQPNEARCRQLAWQTVKAVLATDEVAILQAEGSSMNPEQVCAMTLGREA